MNPFLPYALASLALICLGLFHLIVREHLVRKVLAMNVLSSGVFLLLISAARRGDGDVADPVPHAMVLTGIVIAVSVTALALGIIRRIQERMPEAIVGREEEP